MDLSYKAMGHLVLGVGHWADDSLLPAIEYFAQDIKHWYRSMDHLLPPFGIMDQMISDYRPSATRLWAIVYWAVNNL